MALTVQVRTPSTMGLRTQVQSPPPINTTINRLSVPNLEDLNNVDTTTYGLDTGYILVYNNVTDQWVTQLLTTPSGSFDISGDIGSDTFSTDDILRFTGTANQIITTVTDDRITFALATNVSIANNLTLGGTLIINGSPVAVQYGGTGASSFTTNGILYGNGSSTLQVTAAGSSGKILQANSSGVPIFDDLDGGTY